MFVTATLSLLRNADTRLVCADIGSAGGFHERLNAIRERAEIVGFEADPSECERLNRVARSGERHINAAIGLDGQTVTLELHRKRQTSSIYATDFDRVRHFPDSDRLDKEGTATFTTMSLDTVCKRDKIDRLDYIKADIEGHELAALQGYSGPLLMAEVEVSFHPFRKEIPLFDEIMAHLRTRGFILIDLRRVFWRPSAAARLSGLSTKGFLIHGDALFIRDPFSKETLSVLADVKARARYLALLCLYGYAAEALMVIDILRKEGAMPPEEARASATTIHDKCSRRAKIPIKGVARALRHAEAWFSLPIAIRSGLFVGSAGQADREVGNWE